MFLGLPSINLNKQIKRVVLTTISLVLIFSAFQSVPAFAKSKPKNPLNATMSVFATGLNDPRGLKFGPDGFLYVAEGGLGGSNSTVGQCTQVIPPIGPYTGGMTGRISKINSSGVVSTVADGLPSSQTAPIPFPLISGVADVAFLKGQLYALLAGAGCSHGIPNVPNGIIKVNSDGTWSLFADLSAFQAANPVAQPEADDFEPDGTWYSMVSAANSLYAVEPNHGELVQVTAKGAISRVIDISASQGHIVPTAIDWVQGKFLVGNLTTFPLVQGAAKLLQINQGGKILREMGGFTNIVSVVNGNDGYVYILENTVGFPEPTPDAGMIVRVNKSGQVEPVISGLSLPTAMTFGPDGALYVSNKGFGYPPGLGEIVRVDLGN